MLDDVLRTIGAWVDAHSGLAALAWRLVGIAQTIGLGLLDMLQASVAWLDAHPGIAVWAQGAATVAVFVAIVRLRRADRAEEAERRRRAGEQSGQRAAARAVDRRLGRCRPLVAALRAEIAAALDAATTRYESVNRLDREIKNSIALGKVVDLAPLRFTSLGITEAVAFKALGADVGLLPPTLLGGAVTFYNRVAELNRALATVKTVQQQIWLLQESIPRIRVDGHVLLAQLDRFEAAGFDDAADLQLSDAELAAFAAKAGPGPEKVPDERRQSL